MIVTVSIVLVVLAALTAMLLFGPPARRTSAAATFGGAAAAPARPRFTEADRAYLDGVWKHVQHTFVSNPRVAVTLARSTAEGIQGIQGIRRIRGAEDTETLPQKLLAIKTWSDREAAR